MGRPTDYKPEYCDQIVDLMEQGYSVTAAAGKMRVTRQTVYNWAEAHDEFFNALNLGRSLAAVWWEEKAIELASGKGEGNPTIVVFGLKNRVADEWRDKREVDNTSSDGSMTPKGLDLSSLPADALEAIVKAADGQSDD